MREAELRNRRSRKQALFVLPYRNDSAYRTLMLGVHGVSECDFIAVVSRIRGRHSFLRDLDVRQILSILVRTSGSSDCKLRIWLGNSREERNDVVRDAFRED